MGENKEQRLGGDETVDRLSNLPESLLLEVLLNLPTMEVVKTSVLSRRWRNLWRFVPGLELRYYDFWDSKAFVSFVDRYLSFNSESCIQKFMLDCEWFKEEFGPDQFGQFPQWINTVVDRKVEHLDVSDTTPFNQGHEIQIPPTVYTCESLVSLKLFDVVLPDPKFVSLPCVKVINLGMIQFVNDLAFEMLIPRCPLLESLTIHMSCFQNLQVLHVRSQSLLKFAYTEYFRHREVVIDAPRLEYLKFDDRKTGSFIINNSPSLVKVKINVTFNRNMTRKFLGSMSSVKRMTLSWATFEAIYDYSRFERLPIFPNISFLDVDIHCCKWETLQIFFEICPNLKSIVVRCKDAREFCGQISREFRNRNISVSLGVARWGRERDETSDSEISDNE